MYVLTISYFIPQIFFTFDIYCFILIFRQKEPDNWAGKGISLMQISAKNVNTPSVFPMDCEVYYSIRTLIDANEYPQVHDFYEIILVTENSLDILLNNDRIKLGQGNLLLIRPGDIHTKIQTGDSVHINLAFPAYTVNSLFGYLYNSQAPRKELFVGSHSPIVRLSTIDTLMIQNRLSFLNQLSSSDMEEKNTHLRAILIDIMYSYIIPELEKQKRSSDASNLPAWLVPALEGLSNPKNLTMGMDYLVRQTQRSPEHICRIFRKHLGITPSAYINGKRLNYAANLLIHTDMEIVDVIYESGFQSINYFYHLFKKEYGISPVKYKKIHLVQKL